MRAQIDTDSGWSEKKTDAPSFDLKPYDWEDDGDKDEKFNEQVLKL